MRRRAALAVGAAALAGCSESLQDSTVLQPPDGREAETLIRDGITDLRRDNGLPALAVRETLETAAREHSADMADRDFYDHTNPDGDGPTARAGCRAGETIHRGELGDMRNQDGDREWNTFHTDQLAGYVVEGWRLSDAHRELLVSPRWSGMGVGVYVGDNEFFATALFC